MSVSAKAIIPSKYVEDAQTTQYTATNVITIIDKCVITNVTTSAVTFSANLVNSGDTAAADNLFISNLTILPGETYLCPELAGQVLQMSDFISTIAGTASALTIRATGREIS